MVTESVRRRHVGDALRLFQTADGAQNFLLLQINDADAVVAQLRDEQVVSNSDGRRVPVVHLYGRLEGSETVLVRDFRQRPHFYVRAADAGRVVKLGAPEPYTTNKQTFDGAPVCRLEVETPPDVPGLRDRLHAAGIDTFEADVRFAIRYLIERGIKANAI